MITLDAGPGKTVIIHDSTEDLAVDMASRFVEYGIQCIHKQDGFWAAFSGGKTPEGFLKTLAKTANGLDFEKMLLFQTDERMVSAHHSDSNQAMITRLFVEPAGFPKDHFYPVPVNTMDSHKAAYEYEHMLQRVLTSVPCHRPGLDYILLGVGEDGHTASLFPGGHSLSGKSALAEAALSQHHAHARVTLSEQCILNSGLLVFMAQGPGKADVVKAILSKKSPDLPASRIWEKAVCAIMALDQQAGRAYLDSMA